MNERQKEQQHVNETIALIHREQAILSQQKQELAAKMDDQLKEIAEYKMPDLNAYDLDAAMKIVAGTAKNMGVKVEGIDA